MARGPALVLALFWGCAGEPARPAAASAPPREVRLAVAGRASRSVTTEVVGTVRAVRSATVAPVVSGTVAEVRIGLGSAVRAGDVLVRLSAREVDARLEQTRAVYALAKQERDRAATLHAQDAISVAQYDAALSHFRVAEARQAEAGTLAEQTVLRAPFALVNFAMADGFIVGFEAKYRFRFWRPETATRDAAEDGNPRTKADPTWKPFLITPPVPDYPSTHTVLGWAAAEALIALLGDDVPFTADSLTLPGVTRQYEKLSTAAEENGMSRIYAGIHFQHAVKDGKRQGRSVGRAAAKALQPIRVTRRE